MVNITMRWIEVFWFGAWQVAWMRDQENGGVHAQIADDAPYRFFTRWRELGASKLVCLKCNGTGQIAVALFTSISSEVCDCQKT